MPSHHSEDSQVEDLKLFLAHFHGLALSEVKVRGLVPGEDPSGYATLVNEAMQRAWRERGNRPLPPGYDAPG